LIIRLQKILELSSWLQSDMFLTSAKNCLHSQTGEDVFTDTSMKKENWWPVDWLKWLSEGFV
jgi:hypothetical protein